MDFKKYACLGCRKETCEECEHKVYATGLSYPDSVIEELWLESEDVYWNTYPQYDDDFIVDCEMVLGEMWRGFPVNEFTIEDFWHWIDDRHSKGVGWVHNNTGDYAEEIISKTTEPLTALLESYNKEVKG